MATTASLSLAVSPAHAAAQPSYKFLQVDRDGSAVAWPCGTQHVKLYKPPTPGHAKVVQLMLERISSVSPTKFVLAGETTVSPRKAKASDPTIIVGFDAMDPKWAGWAQRERTGGRWTRAYVTLNTAVAYVGRPATTADWDRLRNTVLHELGHLAGLDHVDVASEVMFGKWNTGRSTLGSGDQAGLKGLGCERSLPKSKATTVVSGDGLAASTGPSVSLASVGALTASLHELVELVGGHSH